MQDLMFISAAFLLWCILVDLRYDSKAKRIAEAAERRNWLKQKEIDLHKARFDWEKVRSSEQSLLQQSKKGVEAFVQSKTQETVEAAKQNMLEAKL